MRSTRFSGIVAAGVTTAAFLSAQPDAQTRPQPRFVTDDPACQSATLVATGGAAPRDPDTLAVRWSGTTNFELSYKGQVVLLDAYFDRGKVFPSIGFHAADVKKADVLLIGHGHFDHMSDAASVVKRTGASVVGAAVTTEKLAEQSVPASQLRTVNGRGQELLKFGAFSIEPVLGSHGVPALAVADGIQAVLDANYPKRTDEEIAEQRQIQTRGSRSDRMATDGTITYLITLDSGFRIIYRDSPGVVTDWERSTMARIGPVDLAIVALPGYIKGSVIDQALEYLRTYKPSVFIPAHHDAARNVLARATEPVFQALKDENPRLVTISKAYREPICFDVGMAVARVPQD